LEGEWDLAYIVGEGTSQETLTAGEWTFTWINNGQAVQDVLSVPYQWGEPAEGASPIQMTTIRMFNPKRQIWEGMHIMDGAMVFFAVTKNQTNQLIEHYQQDGGPLMVWLFDELTDQSFKVVISSSSNQGASWSKAAEIWAKRRQTVAP
jgi:hypothetical protein